MPLEKGDILHRVLADRLPAAGAVGDPPGIPEIDQVFLREQAAQLLNGRQTAQSRIKNTDGSVIHIRYLTIQIPAGRSLFRCTRERKLDQPVDQFGIGDACRVKQLGIHRNRGEAGQGVDLVEDHTAIFLREKVDPGKSGAAHRGECVAGCLPDDLADRLRNPRWDIKVG